MLSLACNLSIWEAEAAGFEIQGHPLVQRKAKMGLNVTLSQNKQQKKEMKTSVLISQEVLESITCLK